MVRCWILFIRTRWATSGGRRLNFFTALSGSGSAKPIGVARTGPTSLACSSLRSNFEVSSRVSGETVSNRQPDLVLEHGAAARGAPNRHR